jgi:DNA-3-methyladenine glycosylase II
VARPELSFEFAPRGAFSLARTTARFARHGDTVNVASDEGFARLVPVGGHALVRIAQSGSVARPKLAVRVDGASGAAARAAAERALERLLGATADLRPFERALGADPLLGDTLRAQRGLRVAGSLTLFEALVGAVLTQQVNLAFAFSIRAALVDAFGARATVAGREWRAFPTPERIAREDEATLRGFRMTNAKAGTIARLARAFAEGALDEEKLAALPDEDAIAELVRWKGVGRWTAEVALLRGLGRLDIFPAGDLAVLKRLALGWLGARAPVGEAEVRAFSERWRPWRSLALVHGLESLNAHEPTRRRA